MLAPLIAASLFAFSLMACTATGDSADMTPSGLNGGDNGGNSGNGNKDNPGGDSQDSTTLSELVEMVNVSAMGITRNDVVFSVSAYSIGATEVTQGLYRKVMGAIPKEDSLGDDYPVFNVSWYDAALFCNALSKKVGLDTAYVYESLNAGGELVGLSINYAAESVRLPTEMEWEIAARAGTLTTYYWDTDVASKYAYYGQSKGPTKVAEYIPNDAGLYDMAGNVAEWVNDWYYAYPTVSQKNYSGPDEGNYKVLRGGGWSDKAPALATGEREKKDPKHRSQTIGFRIVYSSGI
ncbi:formylglycine-generating enzyme family protein [Fibrobacter sp.]|uniref:formylglycine-generating enzyme family protein n=1 Tax=Fibrobacter sp. TaxID=35828 RepID=UPI00386C9A87